MRLDLPPPFTDSTTGRPVPFAGPDAELLRQASLLLDGLTFRPLPTFDAMQFDPAQHRDVDYRLWWGTLRYATGLTTLTIEGKSTGSWGSTVIKVYLDGVEKASITPGATWTDDITLTGYTDGQFIGIEVRTSGNTSTTARHVVYDLYATPIVVSETWPGPPTWGSTYTAAKLNQVRTQATYCWQRLNAIPAIVPCRIQTRSGTHKIGEITLYVGTIQRSDPYGVLSIVGQCINRRVAQTRMKVYLGGSLVHTGSTLTAGTTTAIDTSISLAALTEGTRAEVRITEDCLAPDPVWSAGGGQAQDTLWTFDVIGAAAPAGGYPAQTPPAAFAADTSISATNLTTALTTVASTIISAAVYTGRLVGRPWVWGRVPVFRRRYAQDAHEDEKGAMTWVWRRERLGQRLVVYGKNVTLNWGAITVKKKAKSEMEPPTPDWNDYTFTRSESVTDGGDDQLQVKEVWFDALKGFPVQTRYTLLGDVRWAGEYME